MGKLGRHLAWIFVLLLFLPGALHAQTQAIRVHDLTSTLCIQIKAEGLGQSGGPTLANAESAMAYLNPNGLGTGISCIRDESNAPSASLNALGALGYGLDLYTGYPSPGNLNGPATITLFQGYLNSGYLKWMEGMLEVDNGLPGTGGFGCTHIAGCSYTAVNGTTYNGNSSSPNWEIPCAQQSDIWNAFNGKVPLYLWSLAVPTNGEAGAPAVAACNTYGVTIPTVTNNGNVHFYQANGLNPALGSSNMQGIITNETGYSPVGTGDITGFGITETGFINVSDPSENYYGTGYVNGVYTLDTFFLAYSLGSVHTVMYEMFDDATSGDEWGFYGFSTPTTPRDNALYTHNLMAIIGDTASNAATFAPGSMSFSTSTINGGFTQLMQQANGTFMLAVGANVSIYTGGTQTTAPTQTVTVNLGRTFGSVQEFDPVIGTSAQQTLANASSITVSITDHPVIISASAAAGCNPPTSANNAVVKWASTAQIVDAACNTYSITSGQQVSYNGSTISDTSNVIALAYVNGQVCQENNQPLWYCTTSPGVFGAGTVISPLPASRAEQFLHHIGANTHLTDGAPYTGAAVNTAYAQLPFINMTRDQAPTGTDSQYTTVANAGQVKFDLLLVLISGASPGPSANTTIPEALSSLQSTPGTSFTAAIEGCNECNSFYVTYNGNECNAALPGGAQTCASLQQYTYSEAKSIASGAIPVLGTTASDGVANYQTYLQDLGNLTAYANYAVVHMYPADNQPQTYMYQALQLSQIANPGQLPWITETGYCAAPQDTGGNGVDQATQAKNSLNTVMDTWQLGFFQMFFYELQDDEASPPTNDCENNYGLFTSTSGGIGSAKPAATALAALGSILTDTGANALTFTPGNFAYTVTNLPASPNGFTQLFQKSSGEFDIAVWDEYPNWNGSTHEEITVSPVSVTVSFPATETTVKVYDPYSGGTSPINTYSNVASVVLSVTDHPLIVQIPAPTPSIPFGGAIILE